MKGRTTLARLDAGRGLLMASITTLALCAGLTSGAEAQRRVQVDRFRPALDADGFLGVQGTRTPGPGLYVVSFVGDYAANLLEVATAGGERDVVADRVQGQFAAEFGIGGRLAAAVALPVVFYQRGERALPDEPELPPYALEDPTLSLRYRFVGEAETGRPGAHRDGPGVALQLDADLPAGEDDAHAGEGVTRLGGQLLVDFHVLGMGAGLSLGYRRRLHERQLYNAELRDEVFFGAAARAPLPGMHPLSGLIEVRGTIDFDQPAAIEGEAGLRADLGEVAVGLAGGMGLSSGGIGAPDGRVVMSLWYAPRDPDTDGDGVPDKLDQCPPLPEDPDGFQDGDGCPDPDNDNDLVPDADDLCPNDEALEGYDDDEDGCTDEGAPGT